MSKVKSVHDYLCADCYERLNKLYILHDVPAETCGGAGAASARYADFAESLRRFFIIRKETSANGGTCNV